MVALYDTRCFAEFAEALEPLVLTAAPSSAAALVSARRLSQLGPCRRGWSMVRRGRHVRPQVDSTDCILFISSAAA